MKKTTLFFLTLFLFFVTELFAQRNGVDDLDRENFFRIGGKVGGNVNKVPGKSYKEGFNYNYQIGGFMQFNFSKHFGLQPEVNFTQSSSTLDNDASVIWDDVFRDGTQIQKTFDYIEVPVLLNINAGENRHVKLQVGPSVGFYLNKPEALKSSQLYKNGELSLHGGLWIQLPFFNIGGRYKMGLSKVTGSIEHNEDSWRNQAIQVFLGFTL